MPLARYFLWAGGALLALLFVADLFLPRPPAIERPDGHLPDIYIHSDRRWPERIVFDTTRPMIVPVPPRRTETDAPPPPAVADIPAGPRAAFAQLQQSGADQLQRSVPRKREAKSQRPRKVVRRYAAPPTFLAARQPQFGWFGTPIW